VQNIKLTIAYDGTNYLGWQKSNAGPSVSETLENALVKLLLHPVTLQAASRTDRGVHANGQVVNFFTPRDRSLSSLLMGVNRFLPKDIVARDIAEMPKDFHPTLDNKGKEYLYYVCHGSVQLPQFRATSWHYPRHLNFDAILRGMEALSGRHDFKFLCNYRKNHTYNSHIRELLRIDLHTISNDRLYLSIKGDHFLYKMARNIVGTLLYGV